MERGRCRSVLDAPVNHPLLVGTRPNPASELTPVAVEADANQRLLNQMFGMTASPSTLADYVRRFDEVLATHGDEVATLRQRQGAGQQVAPRVAAWLSEVEALRGRARSEQLKAVNEFVNGAIGYKADIESADVWKTPVQVFAAGNGDCEDYAFAKYLSLLALGTPPELMRLLIVQDTASRLQHAILVVADAGRVWLLDNQQAAMLEADQLGHYVPLVSMGKDREGRTRAWMHQ